MLCNFDRIAEKGRGGLISRSDTGEFVASQVNMKTRQGEPVKVKVLVFPCSSYLGKIGILT